MGLSDALCAAFIIVTLPDYPGSVGNEGGIDGRDLQKWLFKKINVFHFLQSKCTKKKYIEKTCS